MRQEPIPVVVSFPLTEQTRATIEGASPLVRILDYPAERIAPGAFRPPPTAEQAAILAQAEVLFGSHLDPIAVHDAAPNLKWFQVLTAGLDELIAQGILEKDFTITTMSGVGAVPIAEYCMGVMVMLEKDLHETMRDQVEHRWNFHFAGQLKGKTCGVVGLGAIGRELAKRARAFGMRVVATRRSAQPGDSDRGRGRAAALERPAAAAGGVGLRQPVRSADAGHGRHDRRGRAGADEARSLHRQHRAGDGHRHGRAPGRATRRPDRGGGARRTRPRAVARGQPLLGHAERDRDAPSLGVDTRLLRPRGRVLRGEPAAVRARRTARERGRAGAGY